ncbi:MAG: hybrid sensor histidine kinase/response regulator [Ottowia sp.]
MTPAPAADTPGEDHALETERMAFALGQSVRQNFAPMAACVVVALALAGGGAPIWQVLLWVVPALGIYWVRRRRLDTLRRSLGEPGAAAAAGTPRWRWVLREYIGLTGVAGAWVGACPAWFMSGLSGGTQLFTSTVLCGWVAASLAVLGVYPLVFVVYSALILTGVALGWAYAGLSQVIELLLVELAFIAVMARSARDFSQRVIEGLRIRRENDALMAAAQQARLVADEANAAKSRFLAVASHDLRQPLHALSLLNGLLVHVDTVPKARELANQMAQSIHALDRLFGAVLDFSKLEASAVSAELQWIRLRPMVERCMQIMNAHAQAKGLVMVNRVASAELLTDALLFERVLRNLLDNAIKYTSSGTVTVETSEGPRGLELVVSDTGCGIPANVRGHIFKEYYQGPGARQMPGLGLGLPIVRRLCGLLRLIGPEASDNQPQGSRFTLIAPPMLWRPSGSSEDTIPQLLNDTPDLAGLRILCVDDDGPSLAALASVLRVWGCQPHTATSAKQALALASELDYVDVILSDQDLSDGETGVELIGRLRDVLGEIPAALVTGDPAILAAQRQGDIEFPVLTKPVRHDDLKAMLHVFKELED